MSVFRLIRFLGPPAEPDVPVPGHSGSPQVRAVGSGRGGGCCPWEQDPGAPVAVTGDRHGGRVEQADPSLRRPPSWEEASAQARYSWYRVGGNGCLSVSGYSSPSDICRRIIAVSS